MPNKTLRFYRFEALLQQEDWLTPAFVGVDHQGIIRYVSNTPHPESPAIEAVMGYAIPGFQNAHSHAFQYAMAGLAEIHPAGKADDFWSWREAMYQCALLIGPEESQAIAAMLYAEMLRHGYTHVAEFHYIHHDKDGKPYAHLAEMGERMVMAAQSAGIKITLIPVFYQQGGFGLDPQPRQRRFISKSTDDYLRLLEASGKVIQSYPDALLGCSVHSLRAVNFADIARTLDLVPKELPFHIHVAEQQREVMDCLAFCGARPMQWLLENVPVDDRFHLVHATHLDDNELNGIISTKSNVVLCPSTEGNLGDGIFRMKEFAAKGGRWSVGTDSHIGLNPWEEFRMMDYRQRITTHHRNTFSGDAAKYLVAEEITTGRKAMGIANREFFALGQPFDALVLDSRTPLLAATSGKHILSSMVYAGDSHMLAGTIVNGQWIVKQQEHIRLDAIRAEFESTMRRLATR
ncbi:MAG TPA: formimidoylglutamate deiminase [Cyclobacteriaceae bacterium]|nr:formimidoylglutamate deiminase [Cyclobacteriaceae bacterium]